MTHTDDIRWKQRFYNFRRAFTLLQSAFADNNVDDFSDLEKEGVIQRFEYTYELGWKTFRDYLEFSGIQEESTPRRVIKKCAAAGIFQEADINPEIFLDMMLTRNALSHTYDFEQFNQAIEKIQQLYLAELEKTYMFFISKELEDE